jgi:CheY-like chemotaxis protein
MKVLIIEDTADNMYLMRYLLETEGHQVTEAADAVAGVSLAAHGGWSVVLLDIQLPGADGYQIAAKLKTMPVCEGIPLIAVTSFAMPGDRERAIGAGFDWYLEKPIRPETFVSEILAVVEGDDGPDPGRR